MFSLLNYSYIHPWPMSYCWLNQFQNMMIIKILETQVINCVFPVMVTVRISLVDWWSESQDEPVPRRQSNYSILAYRQQKVCYWWNQGPILSMCKADFDLFYIYKKRDKLESCFWWSLNTPLSVAYIKCIL